MLRLSFLTALFSLILLAWPARPVTAATAISNVDMSQCLRIASKQARPDEARCPGFIVSALAEARTTCREVGGKLVAASPATLSSLDVNADGQPEYLFDFSQNVGCDGAASVFSCGSLGCGLTLYGRRGGQWQALGNLPDRPAAIEAVAGSGRGGYADLRVGCGEPDCAEIRHYRWNGRAYDLAGLEVRGHAVDIPAAGGQIWTLTRDVAVLAEPRRGAKIVGHYKRTQTMPVILGKARGAPYYYVSPCRACESGFVEQARLRRGNAR